MPYLRIICPNITPGRRRTIAQRLTDVVSDLFYNPYGYLTREQLREHTTIYFNPYYRADLFIGGRTPEERSVIDVTVELSDWWMSARQQRKVAKELTPVLAELFSVPSISWDVISIRFHSYTPTDFAIGGRLLADIVPHEKQTMRRLFG